MTYNTSSTNALDDNLLRDSEISRGEIERVTPDTTGLQQKHRKLPTPAQLHAPAGSDGIKAFMKNFAASSVNAETDGGNSDVAPATRDFLKASSFLFRK